MKVFISQMIRAINIIPREFDKKLVKLLALIFIGSILEMFSIGVIFPLITRLSQFGNNLVPTFAFVDYLSKFFHITKQLVFYTSILFGVILLFVTKAIFQKYLFKNQASVAFNIQKVLSMMLLSEYLSKPYSYFKKTNSSFIIRNITVEVNEFSLNVILPSLYLFTEIFISMSILIVLIILEPIGTILIITISFCTAFVYKFKNKDSLLVEGQIRQESEAKRFKVVQEAINSIKEIKVYSKESFFLNLYDKPNSESASSGMFLTTVIQIPRLLFESSGIISICILMFINIYMGKPIHETIAIVGVLSAASFRLMPSVTRIMNSIQSIKYSVPVINQIFVTQKKMEDDILSDNEIDKKAKVFNESICLENISFKHEKSEKYLFNNLNIKISKNDFIGIVGQSGAGKSTLIELLMGLIDTQEGNILVDDKCINSKNIKKQLKFGYVPQTPQLFDSTILENITYHTNTEAVDITWLKICMRITQLDKYSNQDKSGLFYSVGENGINLSGGERQRVGFARALYRQPSVLILDEATSALDKNTEQNLIKELSNNRNSMTIIFISHKLDALKYCNKIYKLSDSKLNLV